MRPNERDLAEIPLALLDQLPPIPEWPDLN